MKKLKVYIGLLLCMTLVMAVVQPAQAKNSITNATIKEMESQITKAEKEMKELKSSLSDVKGMVK